MRISDWSSDVCSSDLPTILVARTGQRDIVTAACPIALELGLAPGMAAAHARALVTDLDVLDAAPAADAARLGRLHLHAPRPWAPTPAVSGSAGLSLDLPCTTPRLDPNSDG